MGRRGILTRGPLPHLGPCTSGLKLSRLSLPSKGLNQSLEPTSRDPKSHKEIWAERGAHSSE